MSAIWGKCSVSMSLNLLMVQHALEPKGVFHGSVSGVQLDDNSSRSLLPSQLSVVLPLYL